MLLEASKKAGCEIAFQLIGVLVIYVHVNNPQPAHRPAREQSDQGMPANNAAESLFDDRRAHRFTISIRKSLIRLGESRGSAGVVVLRTTDSRGEWRLAATEETVDSSDAIRRTLLVNLHIRSRRTLAVRGAEEWLATRRARPHHDRSRCLRGRHRDEPVDGGMGVVLDRRVAEVAGDAGLVEERAGDSFRGAGLEHTRFERVVDDNVHQALGAVLELVCPAQSWGNIGHDDALQQYSGHQSEVSETVGARGVSRAHGNQPQGGVVARQRRYPQRTEVFRLPVGQLRVDFAAGEDRPPFR
jgi:hypothetical protein